MNMRNINVITALSVPGKTVSDDFMHAVLSNCATRIVLPAPEKFGSESLPDNFNMTAVGVRRIQKYKEPSMNKLVSDGSVKKINYPVLYESGITPPLCEVSAPEPDAGGKRIVAYVYKSSRSTVFENPDIVKTCTVRDLKNDFVNCDEKGEGQ